MNEMTPLERGYRRVLACYPKRFRQENADEVIAVLLASAADSQRRVGLAETAALVRGALRMRLRPAGRPPGSVRAAIRLLCAGAVAELAATVTMAVTASSVLPAMVRVLGLTAGQWHTAAGALTVREAGAGVATVIWLLLAWAVSQRRDVARVCFSAFFALITITMIIALAGHAIAYAPADVLAGAALWLIALATLGLLFSPRSNAYYRQGAAPPLSRAAG